MAGVKYIGPMFDGSGYAEAARNYVLSIYRKGYPITLAPISFEKTRPDLGKDGEILKSLVNNRIDYDKVIVHSTPDLWTNFTQFEKDKRIIGYTVWEASKLHPVWTKACNQANEVWLPCEWNMEVFKSSGVTVPLYKIPHAIDVPDPADLPSFNLSGVSDDTFVFYSVFQWQERKNPYALLTAYSSAFSGVEDVILVIKTYRFDQTGDREAVKKLIMDYRNYINLEHFPKMFLVVENMSRENMLGLHKRGDCFVLLQRSEGWGLPHFEAAACGKPVITPGYGGQTDFLDKENSYPINYSLTPVCGMNGFSPYYRADQMWCEADVGHAIETMRYVYNHRPEARAKGALAKQNIAKNFTWESVGDKVVSRLVEIDQGKV